MRPGLLNRALFASGVVAICAWVLVPIWLIASAAVGGQKVISA